MFLTVTFSMKGAMVDGHISTAILQRVDFLSPRNVLHINIKQLEKKCSAQNTNNVNQSPKFKKQEKLEVSV